MLLASFGLVAAAALAPGSNSAPASPNCSRAAADQAILALHLEANPGDKHPAAQVLCNVPVFGVDEETMVASVRIPSCGGTGDWLIWSYGFGRWGARFESHNGAQLAQVGGGIKETQSVLRPGDAHCFPTGGTRSRVWRWNGTKMVTGAWKYSRPKERFVGFRTPSRNIVCVIGDPDRGRSYAWCESYKRPHTAELNLAGRVRICNGIRCIGDPGEGEISRTLAYGRSVTVGRFRCTSRMAGMTCVVTATGKGFMLNRDVVRRVG
jgi:hypothetical protein